MNSSGNLHLRVGMSAFISAMSAFKADIDQKIANTNVETPMITIKESDLVSWINLVDGIMAMNQMGMASSANAYSSQLLQKMKAVLPPTVVQLTNSSPIDQCHSIIYSLAILIKSIKRVFFDQNSN
jgi:hypothetical protein